MQARMKNPAIAVPGALNAFLALGKAGVREFDVPPKLLELIHLRASQINGCSVCVDMHARDLKKAGETDQRVNAVAAWRDAPWFSDAERAVLALTEAGTRIADRADPVPDEIWNEARKHYDEKALGVIVLHIALINSWNRINAITRQIVGAAG